MKPKQALDYYSKTGRAQPMRGQLLQIQGRNAIINILLHMRASLWLLQSIIKTIALPPRQPGILTLADREVTRRAYD